MSTLQERVFLYQERVFISSFVIWKTLVYILSFKWIHWRDSLEFIFIFFHLYWHYILDYNMTFIHALIQFVDSLNKRRSLRSVMVKKKIDNISFMMNWDFRFFFFFDTMKIWMKFLWNNCIHLIYFRHRFCFYWSSNPIGEVGFVCFLVYFIYLVTKSSITCSPLLPVIRHYLPFVHCTTIHSLEWRNCLKGPVSFPSS